MTTRNIAPLNVDTGTSTYLTPPANPSEDDLIAVGKAGNLRYGIPGKTFVDGVGQACTPGHTLFNNTAAVEGGTQQWSPAYCAQASGSWVDSGGGVGTTSVAWLAYTQETASGKGSYTTGGWAAYQNIGGTGALAGIWIRVAIVGLISGVGNIVFLGAGYDANFGIENASANGNAKKVYVTGQTVLDEGNGGDVVLTATSAKSTLAAAKNGGNVDAQLGAKTGSGSDGSFRVKNSSGTVVFEVGIDGTVTLVGAADGVLMTSSESVAPVAKQDVTGSRGDGTALANLLTALAAMNIITDSTTA